MLESLSRLMPDVTAPEHRQAATAVRELLAAYRDHEDLISVGAYRRGSNRIVDVAIEMQDDLNRFLRQAVEQPSELRRPRARDCLKLHQQYTLRMRGERPRRATPTPTRRRPRRPAGDHRVTQQHD